MRSINFFTAAVALMATVQTAWAQTPGPALEIRGSYAIPTGEWNEEYVLENGGGFGANAMIGITPQIGLYAGWETFSFSIEDVEADGTETGFRAGVSIFLPLPEYPAVTPFLEFGGMVNKVELDATVNGTSVQLESDATLGWEAGVGFAAAVQEHVSIVPVIRYRQHELQFDGFQRSDALEYLAFSLGLRLSL